jgi:hypothetical protein
MLIRRLDITALELLAEAIFLGLLFGLLLAPSNFNALALGSLPVVCSCCSYMDTTSRGRSLGSYGSEATIGSTD